MVTLPAARPKTARSERFEARRESIIDLAAGLFARNGYASTGVADLGEHVGLERGALYYYIGSKEQLLADIHDRVMTPLLRDSEAIHALSGSPLARLRLLSESLLEQVIGRRDHVWVFLHEYRALTGSRRTRFRQQRETFEGYIRALIAQAVKEGVLRSTDTELAVLSFLGMHNYTYQWTATKPGITPNRLSRYYCGVFFTGLAAVAIDLRAIENEATRLRTQLSR